MPFLSDFFCNSCEYIWEDFIASAQSPAPCCPICQSTLTQHHLTGALVTKMHDPELRKAELKRRSEEHSKKEMQKKASHTGKLPPITQKLFKDW